MYGSVTTATVDAAGRGGRATARSSLKVATSRAGGVGASVGGTGVVEGTDGADWVGGRASGSDVAEVPAVLALSVPVRGVGALDSS